MKQGEKMHARTIEAFVRKVVTAPPGASLREIAQSMEAHNVGAIVIADGQRPVGIITDRDLALELGAHNTPPQTQVARVMNSPVHVVESDLGVFDTTAYMNEYKVRRLAVVDDDGLLIGIVTLDDLLRLLTRELANLVEGIASAVPVI